MSYSFKHPRSRKTLREGLAEFSASTAGDLLAFSVAPGDYRSVVLLSVDGEGRLSVYYPDATSGSHTLSGEK